MKKILIALLATFTLMSCFQEELHDLPQVADGEKVRLNISLNIPELTQPVTRAFGDDENEDGSANLTYLAGCPLQLVVFDANGYLTESVDVTPTALKDDEVVFSVELTQTSKKRIIHFIVNSPCDAEDYVFGHESVLIGELSTSLGTKDGNVENAYWQRLEFPNGIDETTSLSRIPMIRNFSKITVASDTIENFKYSGYIVVNAWDKGTVAPYMGEGLFAPLNNGEAMRTYSDITNNLGYEGIWPSDAEAVYENVANLSFRTAPFYLYERRNTYVSIDIPASFLIIKGEYKDVESYYKLDLVYDLDESGINKQYYNILRNFHYDVRITGVSGAGYSSAAEAAKHAASNNLMGSIDIRDLTNISDGFDRLYVSYTDTTVMDTKAVELKYKYIKTSNDTYTNANVVTSDISVDNDNITDIYYTNTSGETIYIYKDGKMVSGYANNTGIVVDADGWSTLFVAFKDVPEDWQVKTNTLRNSIDGLTRETDFNLRRKMYMIVECDPARVGSASGSQVAGNILIPAGITGESDPYQLFPLYFLVEAENMTISPDAEKNAEVITASPSEMPVVLGESIVPGKAGKSTFRYQRAVTNEEYQSLPTKTVTANYDTDGDGIEEEVTNTYKVIPCNFLTNCDLSASDVYAYNQYFTLIKAGRFENALAFQGLAYPDGVKAEAGSSTRFVFSMNTIEEVTVTLDGLTYNGRTTFTYTPTETGVQTLTLSTVNASGTVTVTLSAENYAAASLSAEQKSEVIIPAGNITFSLHNNTSRTVYVYSDSSYSTQITSFTVENGGTNPSLNLGAITTDYNTTYIYFRYSSRGGQERYVASATVQQLLNGVTLNFNQG